MYSSNLRRDAAQTGEGGAEAAPRESRETAVPILAGTTAVIIAPGCAREKGDKEMGTLSLKKGTP